MHRAYLIQLIAAVVLTIVAIAVTLWAINPYGLYPGVSQSGPGHSADLFWHLRLHKPYAMQQLGVEQLIIGSSRSARLSPSVLANAGIGASPGGEDVRSPPMGTPLA